MKNSDGGVGTFKNIISFLLVKLFLWIPLCYLIAILLASALYGFKLGDYSSYIFIGVFLCFVLAFLLALRRAYYISNDLKKGKNSILKQISTEKDLRQEKSDFKKPNTNSDELEAEDKLSDNAEPIVTRSKLFKTNLSSKQEDEQIDEFGLENSERALARKSLLKSDEELQRESERETALVQPKFTEQRKPICSSQPEPTLTLPRYFRSRKDPNVVLLEYSDRLEVYRKTINGLEYQNTEYK